MLQVIEVLKEIRERCMADRPLTMAQLEWLGRALDAYLSQRCDSLREAFGLCQERGGIPWWLEQAMLERDNELRLLAERFLPDLALTAKSKAIAAMAQRYAASAWRFDRDRSLPPEHYQGTPKWHLWRAFKSGAKMPVSERRLRSLLAE